MLKMKGKLNKTLKNKNYLKNLKNNKQLKNKK